MIKELRATEFGRFRLLGLVEGVSFLVILLITMPMKYMMGIALPNKILGMIHGALFLFYCFAALQFFWQRKWSVGKLLLLWVAAIIPLGTFAADHWLLAEDVTPADEGEVLR